MIRWKDFIWDEVMGPVLNIEEVRREEVLSERTVKEDTQCKIDSYQETGQEQRPARMVGHSSLVTLCTPLGMEAERPVSQPFSRKPEEAV